VERVVFPGKKLVHGGLFLPRKIFHSMYDMPLVFLSIALHSNIDIIVTALCENREDVYQLKL